MANNRLYLVDLEEGEGIMLAKSFGDGWDWVRTKEEMNKWLEFKDIAASCGPEYPSNLKLMNESEYATFNSENI